MHYIILSIVSFCLAANGQTPSAFSENATSSFADPKSVDIDIYVLLNSSWTRDIVAQRVQKLLPFFFPCEIYFRQINIQFINDSPFAGNIFERSEGNYRGLFALLDSIEKLSSVETNERLKLFYLNKFTKSINGIAFPDGVSDKYRGLVGSVFISTDVIEWETRKAKKLDEDFSVEAHELGHILLNRGHVLYGQTNFMAPEASKSRITDEQCRTLRESRFINND